MQEMPDLNWIKSIFSKEEDINKIWNNWAADILRSSQELLEIVSGPYQEEFQKRALFLLLAPYTRSAPFYWQHQAEPEHFLNSKVDFRKVDPALRAHAVYWLTKFIDYARCRPIKLNLRKVLLDAYNKYILQLLAILPAEDNQAETLFQYFSINDPTPWEVLDEHETSGYNPLLVLWKNLEINEKWKRLAEIEMRKIIKRELCEESIPREQWENALRCYARHLQSHLPRISSFLSYSKELLADQLDFLTSLEVDNLRLIRPESIALIYNILSEEKYQSLRWKLARFVVLRDNNFRIYSEQTEEAAQMILHDPSSDSRIYREISDQLNTYHGQNKDKKQKAEEESRRREALLAPMRKMAPVFPKEYDEQ